MAILVGFGLPMLASGLDGPQDPNPDQNDDFGSESVVLMAYEVGDDKTTLLRHVIV